MRLQRRTPLRPRSKLGNSKQEYDGYKYDSRLEAQWAYNLDMLKRAGEIKDVDRQYRVDMVAHDSQGAPRLRLSHKVDFRVHELDGTYTLLEVKGFPTQDWAMRKKWLEKLWLPQNKNYRYCVVRKGDSYPFLK